MHFCFPSVIALTRRTPPSPLSSPRVSPTCYSTPKPVHYHPHILTVRVARASNEPTITTKEARSHQQRLIPATLHGHPRTCCSTIHRLQFTPPLPTRTQVMSRDTHLPLQLLLHDGLGGDTGVVGAGHPQGVITAHAPPAGDGVLRGESGSRMWGLAAGGKCWLRCEVVTEST